MRRALTDLYAWYAETGDELYPIYRDAAHTPESNQRARKANNDRMADVILSGVSAAGAAERRLRAALGHVIGFWTWRSLVVDQGLSSREASALAAEFVLGGESASEGARRFRRGATARPLKRGRHRAG